VKLYGSDPLAAWTKGFQLAVLVADAQSVIATRSVGAASIWSSAPEEDQRVVSEKLYALSQATRDATVVTLSGAGIEAVLAAAIKPLRQKPRAGKQVSR